MNREVCLIMTPKLMELYKELQKNYPEECKTSNVNAMVMLGWVENYQKDFNKTPDFTPDLKSLIPYVENLRKREGKSFLNKEIAQKSEANPILVQFIKDIETLAGYYEGGGRVLSDDVPNFPNELDDKLNNHFMGGEELSLDDYRKLWKVLEFKDGKVYGKNTSTNSEVTLPKADTKINIYAGTGENADLSNFAERPFVIPEDFSVSVPSGIDISYGTIGMNSDGSVTKYRSVEAAFQGIKSIYSESEYPANTDFDALRKQGKALRPEDFAKMSGAEARKNGRNITDLNRQSWDKDSSTIMKALIKLSFEQNPQALQRLLATGNATLTHTQDKGKWGTEFPKLLMKVRDELRKENPQIENSSNKQDIVIQLIDQLKASGITVLGKDDMEKYLTENGKLDPVLNLQAIKENQEMQDIKAKAIANGTFMKAPNGKDTNLTERQWLQVRTKNFINWFGDWINDPANASKVVDENGEPLVVWHNTYAKFNTFEFTNEAAFHFGTKQAAEDRGGNNNRAFFLNIKDLHEYPDGMWFGMKLLTELQREGLVTREQVTEIRNKATDARYSEYMENRGLESKVYAEEIQKILKTKEYGFKYINNSEDKGSYSYGVLSPNQIKSATDNNGMFSTENNDIQMFIGKKARTQFEYQLRKARPDLSDDEIKSTLDFLHSLEDSKENTAYIKAAIRWIANKSLTLPQDHTKAYQVFEVARKKHLDLQKYNTLGELIASPEMQPKEKERAKFNPDEAKTFSNKRTITTEGGRVFTVYDVENTEEGQREVCKALAAHYETSPWCLSTFTSKGEPTNSAKTYWDYYNALPRKIAFENGKPVAFSSAKEKEEDIKLNGLPVTRGDDGETLVIKVNPNSANDIAKLNKMAEEGLVLLAKYDKGVAWPTEEGEKLLTFSNTNNEAWWDTEDTHPQDSLSDSIVSDHIKSKQQEQDIAEARIQAFQRQYEEYVRTGFPEPLPPVYPDQDEMDDLPFFITPEGEVYGFVDEKGNIYLDETVISPEHPIHEYTHLWDIILAKKNPALWNRGKQLLKDKNLKLKGHEKSIWQEIEEDPNYGLKWDKTKSYYEDYVASEVHARLTGKKGLQLLDDIAKQKGSKNIISKLKQWILDVYKDLKATFSKWTPEELDKLTIKDFTYMTLRDFTSGMNLSTVPTILKETSDPNISKEQVNEAKNTLYNIIQTSKFRIDQIQDKIKWNKATNDDVQNLNKYKVKLKEDTELLNGLDTGKSEVYINEYNTPMVRWVNKKEKPSSSAGQSLINSAVQKHQGNWSRQEAQNNPKILYVFTDNTDRDSGRGLIPDNSWYSKKYGTGHHFPTMTAAVVRGLDNSRPISTQRWYHQGAKGETGRWTDVDVEEFKQVIREELQEIVKEYNTGKYDTIMFPDGDGLFNTRISNITKVRTPKLYQALADLLHEYGFDSLIPSDAKPTQNTQQQRGLSTLESNAVDLDVNDKDLEIAKETVKMEKQKVTKPESESLKSSLQVKEDRFTKFKQTLSPQQINDAGVRMAVLFTEKLNILVAKELEKLQEMQEDDSLSAKDKEVVRERLITIQDPIKGRQEVATSYGIANLLDDVKESMKKVNPFGSKEHPERLTARDNVLEYFNEIFNAKASQEIELVEGIQIIDLETKENEEDNEVLDTDDDTDNVATGSDGWSFKMRLQNPANSLSSKVRLMLSGIEKVDTLDSLGYTAYYPVGQVYATCLSYISRNLKDADDFMQIRKSWDELQEEGGSSVFFATGWMESKEDFESTYPYGVPVFPILEKMKDRYPRIAEEMIIRLTNDFAYPREVDPNNPRPTFGSLASQFYAGFKLAMIPYGKIKLGGEAFGITPLNYEMSDRIMYDKLVANYNNRIALTDECIYNSDGSINTENLKSLWGGIHRDLDTSEEYVNTPILNDDNWEEQEYTKEEYEDYKLHTQRTTHDLRSLGIDITEEDIKGYIASGEITTLLENAEKVVDNLTRLKDNDELKEGFDYILDTRDTHKRNLWKDFFTGIGTINSDHYLQSYYDPATGKTKYSYSADNYLMKIFRGIAMGTLEERRQFIDEHFGKYEWFKDQKTGEWKNAWLEYYYNQTKVVGSNGEEIPNFNYPYKNIDNVTYPDGKVHTYTKWTDEDIWYVQHRSYDYRRTRTRGGDPYGEGQDAYYLTPIFSDSPMSMTVLGPKFSLDVLLNNKDKFTDKWDWAKKSPFIDLVLQEVQRIQNVANRKKLIKEGTILPISNYDDIRGLEFCFLPELNNYYFDEGDTFLERMASMKDNASTEEIENTIMRAVTDILENRFYEYLSINKDVITENGFNFEDAEDMYKLRKEFYNSVYANAAIIQLTTVDLAFYKNEIDFQKRFKEVYAGGTQLNTSSRYGKKTENIAIISDDIITSPSYKDIAEIIDNSNRLSQEDKNYIKGIFKKVNVGDAQAIRSMHSFMSVLDMLGDWDNNRMEEALTHFKQGSWYREDFDVIYQTIKPFMFTVIDKSNGDGTSIAVPQQHKNSEICAIMMYNLINESYAGSQSPVYQALSEFMDETIDASGNKLVDMIQFESAVKVGTQGVVNISCNPNKVMSVIEEGVTAKGVDLIFETANNGKTPNDIEHAVDNFKAIKKQADDYLEEGKLSQENYDALIAYLRPTKDEIKEILTKKLIQTNSDGTKTINPERVHTIPFRNYYKQQPTPEHHIDAKAVDGSQARNIIVADLPKDFKLEVPCKGGTKVIEGRDALIDFYYELLNENLIEDFFGKGAKKGLKGLFSSKEELKEAIKQIVRGNPKYSDDFLEALDTNDDGSFKLAPNSPTMFNQMQDIITSFFKNRITKQSINGAALIQAAGIGFDDSLRLQFKDGKLIGIECYMPLTSKDLFEPLLVEREIDGKIVKVLDPKKLEELGLNKAVGYRIPTENKSSIAPLIIKGFTSPQNGSAIMLPAEITSLSGSDFDVDKMFIMLLAFNVITHDMKKAFYDYARSEHEKAQEMINALGKANIEDLDVDEIGQNFKEWFEEHKDEYVLDKPIIKKVQYDFSKSPKENGRKARNNMLIQIRYGILTSKECADLVLNPQGFKDVERAAKISQIVNNPTLFQSFLRSKYTEDLDSTDTDAFMDSAIKKLLKLDTPQLKKFIQDNSISDSPIYPQTFTKSHARNMAGSNQIGIYAIQGSMCAKQQRATITLRPQQQFTINGKLIKNVDVSDEGRRMRNTNQMVGASADNGKNPNLTDMGSTSKTAPIIGLMLREGLSHLEASLLINQPCMKLCYYNSKNKYWYGYKNKYMQTMPVDTVTLIKNIVDPDSLDTLEKTNIDLICYHILQQHEGMEFINKVSRADSPNGALGNSYAKGRVQRYKVDVLQAMMGQDEYPFNKVTETLSNTAVDTSASENTVREQLKNQKMGLLHGMYALGINSFDTLMKNYFFGAQKWFDERIVKPILYSLPVDTPEETLAAIVNNIYKSYMIYKLSSSPLFGDEGNTTVEQKKKYYNESFPDDFVTILHENEDIRNLIGSVLQVTTVGKNKKKRITLQNGGSLSNSQKQTVKDRLESLIYSSNPKAHELAVQLLLYSYFADGLQYNRYSFSTYFSSKYLMSIPMYSEACNHFSEEMDDKDCLNFVMQFLNTYPSAATKMDRALKEGDITIKDDTLIVSNYSSYRVFKSVVNPLLSPNPKKEVNLYPYISYGDILYVLDKEALKNDSSHPTYYKLPRYNTNHFTPFFTSQRSIEELAESMPINSSSNNETQYDEDYFVDDTLGDPNDLEITGFSDNFDTADPSELYAREGENELQDKFC